MTRAYRKSAWINRHVVGDERVLQEKRGESILAPSLAASIAIAGCSNGRVGTVSNGLLMVQLTIGFDSYA